MTESFCVGEDSCIAGDYASPAVEIDTLNGAPFNSSSLLPDFRVVQLTSCTNGTETGAPFDNQYAPGNSNFQFTATTPFTWQYNWQTKAFVKGCYNAYIVTKSSAGVTVQVNGPFKVQLK